MQNKLGQLTQHKTKTSRHQTMKLTPFFRLLHQETTAQFANNLKQSINLSFIYFYVFYTILTHAVTYIVTNLQNRDLNSTHNYNCIYACFLICI